MQYVLTSLEMFCSDKCLSNASQVEGAVIGAGAAAIRELTAKTADDLKSIEKGLQQELVAETKDGLPSLTEIGEGIVDVVETIGEEIVEGAEIVIKEVKAHPELIAEYVSFKREPLEANYCRGAVALAIGVASVVQPELIVGSVAMIGKMAADRAKTTANEIAVEASTHVVKELSKDLNEELAQHAKLEATTTTTDTIKTEKNVDEAAGTITKKEIKQSVKETTIQIGAGEVEVDLGTQKDSENVDNKEKSKTTSEVAGPDTENASIVVLDKEDAVTEPSKDTEEGKHSSVVIKSTTKTTSIKIDEDGTITIGTDTPNEVESAKIAEVVTTDTDHNTQSNVKGATTDSSPTSEVKLAKSLENKIDEALEQVGGQLPIVKAGEGLEKNVQELVVVDQSPKNVTQPQNSDTNVDVPPKPLIVSSVKPSSPETHLEAIAGKTDGLPLTTLEESLLKIHEKLDALDVAKSPTQKEITERMSSAVDSHTHESLAQIHQKLDGIIASRSKETAAAGTAMESKAPTANPAEDNTGLVLTSTVEKIHISIHSSSSLKVWLADIL